MKRFAAVMLVTFCLVLINRFGIIQSTVKAQNAGKRKNAGQLVLVKAGKLLDVRTGRAVESQGILIEGDRVKAVGPLNVIEREVTGGPNAVRVVDLSHSTVLPGLSDCHTHVLLQGDVTAADYDEQLLKESIPYRTIRATVAARSALMNGFTAIRDLETEGAMYADVDVKTAIERGIIPGPRMFVSTRAFSSTGTYPLLGYSWELKVPDGVQIVDGVDNIRRAVREQVKYGADWIKFYADRRYYVKNGVLHSWVNFRSDEMHAMVDEAHRLGHRVAAHAMGYEGIDGALEAGVDSIEHGYGLDESLIDRMVKQGTYWCPTIYTGVYVAEGRAAEGRPIYLTMRDLESKVFGMAVRKKVKIAFGTDAGAFPWTENAAKEFAYMVKYGMTAMQAIQSATIVAAALLDKSDDMGALEPGKYADIVAVSGDPLSDITELERIGFVMKGGEVVRNDMAR